MKGPSLAEPDSEVRTKPETQAPLSAFIHLLWQVLEAGALLIGLIVLVYLLLGAGSGPFVEGVIANIGNLVQAVTPQALIGIAIVVVLTRYLSRR